MLPTPTTTWLVHDRQLDRRRAPGEAPLQGLGREAAFERLHARLAQQRVLAHIALDPQQRAEAARVVEPQQQVAEDDVDMVVLARRPLPAAAAASVPDMPRCSSTVPLPKSSSRYLPRRAMPASVGRAASGQGRTAAGSVVPARAALTVVTLRPVRAGAMPLRVTSTSGNSGMVGGWAMVAMGAAHGRNC